MEGIEDIPGNVVRDGLKWNWESFGDYMNALDGCSWDADLPCSWPMPRCEST